MSAQQESTSSTELSSLVVEDPRTGEIIGEYPCDDADAVRAAVTRARSALRWWTAQGVRGRKEWLLEFKRAIASRAEELAALISAETGKPSEDAILEVMLAVGHLEWAAKNAGKVLGRKRVSPGATMINQSAFVQYQPYGVVGVIGPWNYPLYTPMGSISYALAAGNTVVFKPSELTPGVGKWLADTWRSLGPSNDVIEVVTGEGPTGAALCAADVDKIAFTGSAATGKKVMSACAETLTPVVIEAGGKDAMVIAADGDLSAAAEQAAFGAMGNAGQTCAGVERIYVAEPVFDAFVEKFTAIVDKLAPGNSAESSYGPMTMDSQREIIARHIADALDSGGRAILGGRDSASGRVCAPVILVDVPEDSVAVREETFGPTVVINRVADLHEGIERANGTTFGLGGSIFTADKAAGMEAAERMKAGGVSVNSFLSFAAIPSLPFGGSGDSGFGRIHGAAGLREFSQPKSITSQRFAPPIGLMTMNRKPRDVKAVKWMLANLLSKS